MKELNESQLVVSKVTPCLSSSWTQQGSALQAFVPVVWAGERLAPHSTTSAQVRAARNKVKGREREQSSWLPQYQGSVLKHPSPQKSH